MVIKGEYKVISVNSETNDTVSFVLQGPVMEHNAGQFVMLDYPAEIAGAENPSRPVKRAYSIASSPLRGKNGEIEICVKEMSDGWISKLLQKVEVEDQFVLSGPFGKFVFDESLHKDIVMLSAGSGIAPFAAILEDISDKKLDTNAVLIFSNKTETDIIYRERLDKLASECENAKVVYTLTREEEGSSWSGHRGRVDAKLIQETCGPSFDGKHFFICGPLKFAKSMKELLLELCVDDDKIHMEAYG